MVFFDFEPFRADICVALLGDKLNILFGALFLDDLYSLFLSKFSPFIIQDCVYKIHIQGYRLKGWDFRDDCREFIQPSFFKIVIILCG